MRPNGEDHRGADRGSGLRLGKTNTIFGILGIGSRSNRRFFSGPLRFTGVDLGTGGRSRNGYPYLPSEDGDSTEDDSQATSDEEPEDDARVAKEDALVQSALARIRKAQAKGKQEVKLNKEELGALERRRKRLQAEAEAARQNGSGRRHKEKEQRYSVPLSHFEPPLPGRPSGPSVSDDALPRHPLPSTLAQSQGQVRPGPPMGLFPPPNASRTRPRSATSSSQRPQTEYRGSGSSSPFEYQYVSSPANQRHASDNARPSSSRLSLPRENEWRPYSSPSPNHARDPFLYQTAGPRAPYPPGAAAARRNVSGPSDMTSHGTMPRRAAPAAARSSSEDTSEEDDDTTSDDHGNGVQIAVNRSREEVVVVEASPSPEPERQRGKKSSTSNSSPVKRKPVTGGGRRRKGR
ncbi:Uu.00g041800.m01.CDS01 [Anthostomella pinea]|uniref:Uu.00g041800.m01.CDS01 n=1 Tax=Anthostomella pinea TaxID=933095 RepID=A0AAI8VB47_9PEZI|nr:Uu.00g041800.m01.CDS01 [Anthostomella pinea]